MEQVTNEEDVLGNVVRQSSARPGRNLKSTLSGRLTPRNSPSFHRSHSIRTPRRELRRSASNLQWIRRNKIMCWLIFVSIWAYIGFIFQSKWAHGDNKNEFLGDGNKGMINGTSKAALDDQHDVMTDNDARGALTIGDQSSSAINLENIGVKLAEKGGDLSNQYIIPKNAHIKKAFHHKMHGKRKHTVKTENMSIDDYYEGIPKKNTSYGLLVGPFGPIEDTILRWSPEKGLGTCDRKGEFANVVWSKKFVLIFHELSVTGAPLSMIELAKELLSCGATLSAVVLSKRGGLMAELIRLRIKVFDDSADISFKVSMKADLIIAGSAVCASWIEQYVTHFAAGSNKIVWWIMENRREYFDRAKFVLGQVKMLVFLSALQSQRWQSWCRDENISLNSDSALIPLSVNDELAFIAGIASSLNTKLYSTDRMVGNKRLLRNAVRNEMGLTEHDMLVISLGSINAGKGQLMLLESMCLIVEQETSREYSGIDMDTLMQKTSRGDRMLLSQRMPSQVPKILIGSVGSKSNKASYVKRILNFLSEHWNFSRSLLWSPATTRVASLYLAADAYAINSQGIGETFGRVTIEAMAFGLPVLGTDAGGTKEIVDHMVTGLLHPVGHSGIGSLSENIRFILRNQTAREEMGSQGRRKVERLYLKQHMYKKFAEVFSKCMQIK